MIKIDPDKLRRLLVEPGFIKEQDFQTALEQAGVGNKNVLDLLIESDLIKDEEWGQLWAQERGFPFVNLRSEKIDPEAMNLIPEALARSRQVLAFSFSDDELNIGLVNPEDLALRHALEKKSGRVVKPFMITERDFLEAVRHYRSGLRQEIDATIKQAAKSGGSKACFDDQLVKLLELILEYASLNKASDIHLEPAPDKLVVRFRIDSIMHTILEVPKHMLEPLVMRIKILSRMRTDEHHSAQDGKFQFITDDEKIDIRVSIVPVTEGENVVMRLLSAHNRQLSLSNLGFNDRDLKSVERLIKNPHGMILVTGPTGSGKTTTLYGVLKILNKKTVHVATIEDPVEYDIAGISQIQVNPRTNLTFAQGLRALVRQDPDIIMVGEIRDAETAGIAVNAAMTGHLVLSTLHANDAATTIPRILDMDIEAFLVASTVKVVIAQRLVRRVCPKCTASYRPGPEEVAIIKKHPLLPRLLKERGVSDLNKITLFRGEGCRVCTNSGYSGRVGIFEVMEVTEGLRQAIVQRASADKLAGIACKNGMHTMLADGLDKAFRGVTTLSEVIRVTESFN